MKSSKATSAAVGVAICTLAASAAQAQSEPAGSGVNPFERSGFYVGAVVGEAINGKTENVQVPGLNSTSLSTIQTFASGKAKSPATGGVLVGYRHSLESMPLVLGLEADLSAVGALYDSSSATFTATGAGVAPAGTYSVSNNSSGSSLLTIRSHLGYRFGANEVYFTGGYAWIGKTVGDGVLTYTSPTGVSTTYSSTGQSRGKNGSVLGGGVEHAFSPNLILRAEYLHYSVQSTNQTYTVPVSGRQFSVSEGASGHFDNVRLGLIYQF